MHFRPRQMLRRHAGPLPPNILTQLITTSYITNCDRTSMLQVPVAGSMTLLPYIRGAALGTNQRGMRRGKACVRASYFLCIRHWCATRWKISLTLTPAGRGRWLPASA